jgi:hypothetical protein
MKFENFVRCISMLWLMITENLSQKKNPHFLKLHNLGKIRSAGQN